MMSCETAPVRLEDQNDKGNPEVMFSSHTVSQGDRLKYVLRLYIDGFHHKSMKRSHSEKKESGNSASKSCVIL